MGLLVEGKWQTDWYETKSTGGRFVRKDSSFRHWLTKDGSPGPQGQKGFKAEADRYHLYVSLACPWAHRALLFRKLKGLENLITLSSVNSMMGDEGWTFEPGAGVIPDPVLNAKRMHQVYTHADPQYTGRVTVPVLWDKKENTMVSNESAEIIRMLNSSFDHLGALEGDYYPQALRKEIDEINDLIYHDINNGVYKAGFATTQSAYDEAVDALFKTLDTLEERLSSQRFLIGGQITEADWRLFTTLVRFDPVYVGHFKCNRRRIQDYTHLSGYLRDLYQVIGVAETVDIEYIKSHYYGSHESINPTRIVPIGKGQDLSLPHQRESIEKVNSHG